MGLYGPARRLAGDTEVAQQEGRLMSWLGKVRPQIALAITGLSAISVIALLMPSAEYIAVVTGCTSGIVALGLKVLESE